MEVDTALGCWHAGLINKVIKESRQDDEYLLLVLDAFTIQVVNSCAKLSELVVEGVTGTLCRVAPSSTIGWVPCFVSVSPCPNENALACQHHRGR